MPSCGVPSCFRHQAPRLITAGCLLQHEDLTTVFAGHKNRVRIVQVLGSYSSISFVFIDLYLKLFAKGYQVYTDSPLSVNDTWAIVISRQTSCYCEITLFFSSPPFPALSIALTQIFCLYIYLHIRICFPHTHTYTLTRCRPCTAGCRTVLFLGYLDITRHDLKRLYVFRFCDTHFCYW